MSFGVIKDGALEADIQEILITKQFDPHALKYECILHTVDIDMSIKYLAGIEFINEYKENIGDYTLVNFTMPMGDYIYDIAPQNDNLEMSLITRYYNTKVTNKFKFVITNLKGGYTNSKYEGLSRDELNKNEMANVEGQLVDRVVEILRTDMTQGIYEYTDVNNVIIGCIKEKLDEIKVDGKVLPIDINITPVDNKKINRHVNIPFGVNILDLPSYLQNKDYGVYNNGIGTYFKTCLKTTGTPKDGFFVYDLYNTKRFDEETVADKLMILSSNSKKFEFTEHTYLKDDNIIKILASDVKTFDDGEVDMINEGNTIVSLSPDTVMGGEKNVTDNAVITNPNLHLSKRSSYLKRDSVNKAKYLETDNNLYKHRSEVVSKKRKLYQFQWKYCNHELLYPGMPVAYIYKSKKFGVISLKGVLHNFYAKYDSDNKVNMAVLSVMLESPVSIEYERSNKEKIILN